MMAHSFNFTTSEAQAGGSQGVLSQPELQSETLSQTKPKLWLHDACQVHPMSLSALCSEGPPWSWSSEGLLCFPEAPHSEQWRTLSLRRPSAHANSSDSFLKMTLRERHKYFGIAVYKSVVYPRKLTLSTRIKSRLCTYMPTSTPAQIHIPNLAVFNLSESEGPMSHYSSHINRKPPSIQIL